MKKVKIINYSNEDLFEESMSLFLNEHPNIFDIKFCVSKVSGGYEHYIALIIYEEKE